MAMADSHSTMLREPVRWWNPQAIHYRILQVFCQRLIQLAHQIPMPPKITSSEATLHVTLRYALIPNLWSTHSIV